MITLSINKNYPSLNKWMRLHWRDRTHIIEEWGWLIREACLKAKCGKPNYKRAKVKITLTFPVLRRRDQDNYTPKFVMDALVHSGILQDDRADWVETTIKIEVGPRTGITINIEEFI